MTLPNFLIIGELKSGTTSLWHYCNEHPEIFMPSVKEARYFAFDSQNPEHISTSTSVFPIRSLAEYEKLFNDVASEPAVGEASPNYFHSTTAANRIQEALPNVRLIVSLRNPVDRIYSEYIMSVRSGEENREFAKAFREDAECQRWSIRSSFPYENMKRFHDIFDRSQIHIILYDELKRDPLAVMQNLFRFLGVNSYFRPNVSVVHNPGGIPKKVVLQRAYRYLGRNSKMKKLIKAWMPEQFIRAAKTIQLENLQAATPLDQHTRKEIIEFYHEDVLKLQELIGRDLAHWLT